MSNKIIYLLLAVSLGLNIGVIATTLVHKTTGPPSGPRPGPDHGPKMRPTGERLVDDHVQGMTNHLNLDVKQQADIRNVLELYADEMTTLQVDAENAGRRLSEAYASPEFDPELFRRLVKDASVARSWVDSLSAVMLVAEAAVLTPEQRLKFSEVATMVHTNPLQAARPGGPPPPGEGGPPRR